MPKKKSAPSDISPLDFEKLGKPMIGRFRPFKDLISIRLDSDVLTWFRQESDKYQTLINHACREYMNKHRKSKKDKTRDER